MPRKTYITVFLVNTDIEPLPKEYVGRQQPARPGADNESVA
ncbi:MAG: hypothetical protein QXP80_02545 [Zestosphaera sp.]